MIEEITIYVRDGIEIEKEQWDKLLSDDLSHETIHNLLLWRGIDASFIPKYFGGYENLLSINGHTYKTHKNYVYDSVEELCNDILSEQSRLGKHEIIDNPLEKLTKEELLILLTKSAKLRFEKDKIIREEK